MKRSAILLECRVRGGRSLARHGWIRLCSVLQDRLQNWRDKPVESPVDRLLESSHGDETSVQFNTVQLHSRVLLFAIPWMQHTRTPCPSPIPGACSNSCYWGDDVIQPSHPLSSPSPPAFNPSQHQGLFQLVSSLHQVAKVLESQL